MYTSAEEFNLGILAKQLLSSNELFGTKDQIHDLRQIIKYADWKYYVQDSPILADEEYDILYKRLLSIEQSFPTLITADSPTQRVAYGISSKFPTVSHWVPMLSLENSYSAEDLREWAKKCQEAIGNVNFKITVEPKYDGAGISLYYENDVLQRGATRGDGIQGEDITPNIKQIRTIPLSASFSKQKIQSVEIRGEVIIKKEVFLRYNESRLKEGLPPLANPRNAASGTLRMLDTREVAKRGLHAVLYNISYHTFVESQNDEPEVMKGHYEMLQWLQSIGFSTPNKDLKLCNDIEEAISYCLEFEQKRDDLPFEIDGMVLKINAVDLQEKLGMTSHHPRWAMAYKFKARQATATLQKVEFQVGRTGNITPVAKINPTPIGGVIVSSISLFNEDIIREKDLQIGDTVLVERAGDVIPYIVKSLPEMRDGNEMPIEFPTQCPICDNTLYKEQGEVAWRCINLSCPAQVVEKIIHFASKNAMDIKNLGEANIRRFYELGWLQSIADIYTLNYDLIANLDKFGERSVNNLKEAVEQSKKQSLNRLIFGLGIRFVGETTARTLAQNISHIKDLKEIKEEELLKLEDVGPKVAASIIHFFQTEENILLLEGLERLGVNMEHDNQMPANSKDAVMGGLTFLFTGTLPNLKRSEAEQKALEAGAKILTGVSSKLNYLVAGVDAGSKLEKAKKLGSIKIIDEEKFLKMFEEGQQ